MSKTRRPEPENPLPPVVDSDPSSTQAAAKTNPTSEASAGVGAPEQVIITKQFVTLLDTDEKIMSQFETPQGMAFDPAVAFRSVLFPHIDKFLVASGLQGQK